MNTHEGYSKKTLANTNVLLTGGGDKSLADFLGGIRISASKIQYTTADAVSWQDLITLVNTDENVKLSPLTNNVNRPLMMINGGTTSVELINTTIFSTGIYANTSTNAIIAGSFVKTGSDNTKVLLGDGTDKALSDFAMSNAYVKKIGDTMTGRLKWDLGSNNYLEVIHDSDCGLYYNRSTNLWFHIASLQAPMYFYVGSWDSAGRGNYNKGICIDTSNNTIIGTSLTNNGTSLLKGAVTCNSSLTFKYGGTNTDMWINFLNSDGTDNVRLGIREPLDSFGPTYVDKAGNYYLLLHEGNYKSFVKNMYWANVKVSDTSSTTCTPTFGETVIQQLTFHYLNEIDCLTGDKVIWLNNRSTGDVRACTGGGNFCIGTSSHPSYKLYVNGTSYLKLGAVTEFLNYLKFLGKSNSTSVYARIGYATTCITGHIMHSQAAGQESGAFYVESNGCDSAPDCGGIAIDNKGVTVFGSGDTGSNFTGVFRVINEDNVSQGPQFLVTKTGRGTFRENCYAVHFYESSDIRLKHDISSISQSIRKFKFHNDDRLYYGFIAQELETLHPELVDSSGEYKTVNYNSAICYYIAELENKVQKLEDEINKLKNK